jgi:hypothetical protein
VTFRASPSGPGEIGETAGQTRNLFGLWLEGEESMIEVRKTVTLRETVFSELDVEASRPIARAVGLAVIRNPFANQLRRGSKTAIGSRCDAG